MSAAATLAFNRFGLGARPGDPTTAADPRALLMAELQTPGIADIADADLPTTADALQAIQTDAMARRAARRAKPPAADAKNAADAAMAATAGKGRPPAKTPPLAARLYRAEIAARIEKAKEVPVGFVERLAWFWSNHFAVQIARGALVRGLAGAFEREAIRPHVLGRFEDMLFATARHPAMLVSLDNARSIGPHSPAGLRTGRGINENYGRELMELHTIGVDGGYSQADVIAVADALTGWTFAGVRAPPDRRGRFIFRPAWHEPGTRTIMGKRYAERGIGQGEAVLHDLAHSPATARHIATQLATAFITDHPHPDVVDHLARTFTATGGDLRAVSVALVDHGLAAPPHDKLRTPQVFLLSAVRALAMDPPTPFAMRALRDLGELPWNPPSPAGFPIDSASWLAPDSLQTRIDVARLLAQHDGDGTDPRDLVTAILGPDVSAATREAVARAASRQQGLALLLMSPEFQWS